MKVLCVEANIPGYSEEAVGIKSRKAIDDYDVAVISTDINTYDYSHGRIDFSGGGSSFGIEGSKRLRNDIDHWRKAISDYVSSGGILFIVLERQSNYTISTGYTTPKANQMSYSTQTISNYKIVPISLSGQQNFEGESSALTFSGSGGTMLEIPEKLKKYFNYRTAFDLTDNGNIFYKNRSQSKGLASYQQVGEGYVVLLPSFNFDVEKLTETNKDEEEVWTKQGIGLGKDFVKYLAAIKKYLASGNEITPPPDWVNADQYKTHSQQTAEKKIAENIGKIRELEEANSKLYIHVEDAARLKGLLYETGKQLEQSVTIALSILGYSAEGYDDGKLELDQVIVSPESERFIGECEGKDSKAINVTKFRQLNDSLAADFERDEIEEKARGIIFGNPSRLLSPQDREEWFTQKAISGATREGVALIKTPDLYTVAKYVQDHDDKDFAEKCRKAISESKGGMVDFPKIPDEVEN